MFEVLDVLAVFQFPGTALFLPKLAQEFSLVHEAVAKEYPHHQIEICWDDVDDSEPLNVWLSWVFFYHCVYNVGPTV